MLTELCAELRNYFLRDYHKDIHLGDFTISDSGIESLSFLQEDQYFRVVGSVFNDGVWQYNSAGMENMKPETFKGAVWAMAVPPAVIALSTEIDDWLTQNADTLSSPYSSESFGGYSYVKSSGSYGGGGNTSNDAYGWKNQFANELAPYRRISVL